MPVFARDDVAIHYELRGSGPPLLLVAGLASDTAYWLPAIDELSLRHQLILVDNRGCGRTTPLDVESGIDAMADDCVALLRHLELPRVAIAGHSMGGMIAQACAARDPERFDRMVLAATAPVASAQNIDLFASWATLFAQVDRAAWFRNLYHWVLSPSFFDNPRTVDALVQLAATYPYQQTPQALLGQVEALARFDGRAALSSLRPRTLVLAAGEDRLFPVANAAAFTAAIPHARLVVVEGVAHSFPAETPREFTRYVMAFLAEPATR